MKDIYKKQTKEKETYRGQSKSKEVNTPKTSNEQQGKQQRVLEEKYSGHTVESLSCSPIGSPR